MIKEQNLDELMVIERYLILLLGVKDEPIPSKTHLQKELFFLSRANPVVNNFLQFEKHYFGPYCEVVNDLSRDPIYFINSFKYDSEGKFMLISNGRKIFKKLVEEYKDIEDFKRLLSAMKLVRQLYEKLTSDELLFLIYVTYDEYTEKSHKAKDLLSKRNRLKFAEQLLKKGVITKGRYEELVNI